MITGRVDRAREATIALVLRGITGENRTVEVVIDTGFTDFLTLPKTVIEDLRLLPKGATRVTLADQQSALVDVHYCKVEWLGSLRTVQVLAMEGVPLVGMGLRRGHWLKMHVVPAGPVSIE